MRTQLFVLAMSIILLHISCFKKSTDDQPSNKYDKMLFIRQGGGDKSFYVIPTNTTDVFQININRLDFRDTTISMTISKDITNASSFDALTQALNGITEPKGDFKQPALPTGTWATIYLIKGEDKIEITDTALRNSLMPFENMVTNNIK